MYAYSKKYQTPEIWLLYPVNEVMKDAEISYESFNQELGLETKIRLFFVDVTKIEASLGVLRGKLIEGLSVKEQMT